MMYALPCTASQRPHVQNVFLTAMTLPIFLQGATYMLCMLYTFLMLLLCWQ